MEVSLQILAGATLTEMAIDGIDRCCSGYVNLKHFKRPLSILIGIIMAFCFGLDIIPLLGLETDVPLIGVILAGILMSKGSNCLADWKDKIIKC